MCLRGTLCLSKDVVLTARLRKGHFSPFALAWGLKKTCNILRLKSQTRASEYAMLLITHELRAHEVRDMGEIVGLTYRLHLKGGD